MTAVPCASCTRPHESPAQLCPKCARLLSDTLLRLPDLIDDLNTLLTRQAKPRPGRNLTPVNDTRMPYHLGASDTLTNIRGILISWAKLVSEQRSWTDWLTTTAEDGTVEVLAIQHATTAITCRDDAHSLARWLYRYTTFLTRHDAAAEALHELTGCIAEAMVAIDIKPDPEFIGDCRSTHNGQGEPQPACRAQLYREERAKTVECPKCGALRDVRSLRQQALDKADDRHLTIPQIARGLTRNGEPILAERIYNWAKSRRGKEPRLLPLVVNGRHRLEGRQFLYRVGDVRALLVEMDTKQAARVAKIELDLAA